MLEVERSRLTAIIEALPIDWNSRADKVAPENNERERAAASL
jgi:hypothetical protein